jgi:hypothetical protein
MTSSGCRPKLHLIRLLVLDWFDGPLEAVGEGVDGASYRLRHVGNPPITPQSVYRVELLPKGAFQASAELLERSFGRPTDPVWVPIWDIEGLESEALRSALDAHLAPAEERVGYGQPAGLVGHDIQVVWLAPSQEPQLESLTGDVLWKAINELDANPQNESEE